MLVLRLFRATPAGQVACTFPYMPVGEAQGLVYRLASSLDKINNLSLGQGSSAIQCMYQAVVISGRPMNSYHLRQHIIAKIFLIYPNMVRRAAELLVAGSAMAKVLQPHMSHIGMEL